MSDLHPDEEYFRHLAAGRFMLQRPVSGGAPFFPPRSIAPGSGETALEWVDLSGRGTVYSTTIVRRKPPEPSYNVSLIELAEGPRLMSRVEGITPEQVRIGMAVQARILPQDAGDPLLVFEPVP